MVDSSFLQHPDCMPNTDLHEHAAGLVERAEELRAIAGAAERLTACEPSLVVVEGPAGAGKSRLLGQARGMVEAAGSVSRRANASQLEQEMSWGVVRQLFEPVLHASSPEVRSQLLGGAAAHASPVFGWEAAETPVDPDYAVLHGLYWMTANMAGSTPLQIVVDDLQWADGPSLRFLDFLVRRLDDLPLMVCIGLRSQAPDDAGIIDRLKHAPLAQVLWPMPFTTEGCQQFLTASLDTPADVTFAAACLESTGGSPLLLEELVRELRSARITPTEDEIDRLRELGPVTIAPIVRRRLGELPAEAMLIAQSLFVLGDGAPPERLVRHAAIPASMVEELAQALRSANVLWAGTVLSFSHSTVRDAIGALMDPAAIAAAHLRAAELLRDEGEPPHALAPHLLLAPSPAEGWAVTALEEAARWALANGAAESAVTYLQRAIDETHDTAHVFELLLTAADGASRARTGQTTALFQRAMQLAHDTDQRGRVALAMLEHAYVSADIPAAIGFLDDKTIAAVNDREIKLRLQGWQLAFGSVMSGGAWGDEELAPWRELIDEIGEPTTAAERAFLAQAGAAWWICLIDAPEALRFARATVTSLREAEWADMLGVATQCVVLPLLHSGAPDEARSLLDRQTALAQRTGSLPLFDFASSLRAGAHWYCGGLAAAEADAVGVLDRAEPGTTSFMHALWFWTYSLVDQGRYAELLSYLEPLELSVAADPNAMGPCHGRGRALAALGDHEQALASFQEARSLGVCSFALDDWALSLWALGRADEARSKAAEAMEKADGFGAPGERGLALAAAGVIEGGQTGLRMLADAAGLLDGTPMRLWRARVRCAYGTALRKTRPRDAREILLEVRAEAHAMGAKPVADRALEELLLSGARPRRLAATGLEALTASERRIAAMAADGLSNREIAQQAFVTSKTVEMHLRNTYRKLDITSRTQLPPSLIRQPDGHTPLPDLEEVS